MRRGERGCRTERAPSGRQGERLSIQGDNPSTYLLFPFGVARREMTFPADLSNPTKNRDLGTPPHPRS